MNILTIARPEGALVATGQRTIVLLDRRTPLEFQQRVLIHNAVRDLRTEPNSTQLMRQLERDGADLGTQSESGLNRPSCVIALADVEEFRLVRELSDEDLLRASSTLITGRSADHLRAVYQLRGVAWALRLGAVYPLELDHPALLLEATSQRIPFIWRVASGRLTREVLERVGAAVTQPEPVIAT